MTYLETLQDELHYEVNKLALADKEGERIIMRHIRQIEGDISRNSMESGAILD